MEDIQGAGRGHGNRMPGSVNSQPLPSAELLNGSPPEGGWELVYFAHPHCSSTCAHCWSATTFLGRRMPLTWHQQFWARVNPDYVKEVRLTGGEPFENPDLGGIVDAVCRSVKQDTTKYIFTSGRTIASQSPGRAGVTDTMARLKAAGVVRPGVEIHVSADEHHAGALFRQVSGVKRPPGSLEEIELHNRCGIPYLLCLAANFLAACNALVDETQGAFKGGKLKIHVGQGRGEFHRSEMYGAFDDAWWQKYVVYSEGLIIAGRASNGLGTLRVEPSAALSMFIIPGACFSTEPVHRYAQRYTDPQSGRDVYLNAATPEGHGACIIGFWNLVNRVYCGGSALDALRLLGKRERRETGESLTGEAEHDFMAGQKKSGVPLN